MITNTTDLLGVGLYTPAEAALYSRVRTQLVTRWIFGDAQGEPVVHAQLKSSGEKVVTFLDLVQVLAIRAIHVQFPQISLKKIKLASDNARRYFGVEYPFAMQHKTYVFIRGDDPVALTAAAVSDDSDSAPLCEIVFKQGDSLTQLTGNSAGNRLIKEVAELYLADLAFDATGIASQYTPFRRGNAAVTINPARHFGAPLLPSGYTALTIAEAAKTEGSIEKAADAYGIDRAEVELACGYFDYLLGPIGA